MAKQTRTAPGYLWSIDRAVCEGTTEKRLFAAASKGEIELLFEVHATMPPVLLPSRGGINPSVGIPNPMRTPTYLVLETALCTTFKDRSSVRVQKASRGYLKGSGTIPLRCLDASAADDEPTPVFVDGIESPPPKGERASRWEYWGFHIDGTPRDHPVSKDELLVEASEFQRWKLGQMEKDPSQLYVPPTAAGTGRAKAYISGELMRMCEAAEIFWNDKDVIPGERDTYPLPESVAAWFETCGFDAGPALSAARLIVPDWAQQPGRRSKKIGQIRKKR